MMGLVNVNTVLLLCGCAIFFFGHYVNCEDEREDVVTLRCPDFVLTKQKEVTKMCVGDGGAENDGQQQCARITCAEKGKTNRTFPVGCASDDFCSPSNEPKNLESCRSLTRDVKSKLLGCELKEPTRTWDENPDKRLGKTKNVPLKLSTQAAPNVTAPNKTGNATTKGPNGTAKMPKLDAMVLHLIALSASVFALRYPY